VHAWLAALLVRRHRSGEVPHEVVHEHLARPRWSTRSSGRRRCSSGSISGRRKRSASLGPG
jgi:hypothetical protein